MKRILFALPAVLTLWVGVGLNFAGAQFGVLGQAPTRIRPTVSPFVNLGQGGAGAFYGIIRPQIDANRSILELQQGVNHLNPDGSLRSQLDPQGTNAIGGLQTGHAATFFNTGQYYPMAPGSTSGNLTNSGLGGGLNNGLGGGGFNTGIGAGFGLGNTGGRTFFGPNLAQPLIR